MAVRRNPGGRPSKFTSTVVLAVVTALCQGESLEAAAKSAGIGVSTLYRWLERGRRGDPRFSPMVRAVAQSSAAGKTVQMVAKSRSSLWWF